MPGFSIAYPEGVIRFWEFFILAKLCIIWGKVKKWWTNWMAVFILPLAQRDRIHRKGECGTSRERQESGKVTQKMKPDGKGSSAKKRELFDWWVVCCYFDDNTAPKQAGKHDWQKDLIEVFRWRVISKRNASNHEISFEWVERGKGCDDLNSNQQRCWNQRYQISIPIPKSPRREIHPSVSFCASDRLCSSRWRLKECSFLSLTLSQRGGERKSCWNACTLKVRDHHSFITVFFIDHHLFFQSWLKMMIMQHTQRSSHNIIWEEKGWDGLPTFSASIYHPPSGGEKWSQGWSEVISYPIAFLKDEPNTQQREWVGRSFADRPTHIYRVISRYMLLAHTASHTRVETHTWFSLPLRERWSCVNFFSSTIQQ